MKKKYLISLLVALGCTTSAVSFAEAVQADGALLQAAQKRKDVLVKDLATLVNIDSGTDDAKGLTQVEALLAQRLKEVGASVEIISAPPAAGKMVVGKLQGTGTKNIMLMIHYDTVFGSGEAARRPFKITGNKAFGPGRCQGRRAADRLCAGYRARTGLQGLQDADRAVQPGRRKKLARFARHDHPTVRQPGLRAGI